MVIKFKKNLKKTPARPLGRVGVFPNQARKGGSL